MATAPTLTLVVTTKQGRTMKVGFGGKPTDLVSLIESTIERGDVNAFLPIGNPATEIGGGYVRVGSIASVEILPVREAARGVDVATLREIAADFEKLGDKTMASSIRIAIGDERLKAEG